MKKVVFFCIFFLSIFNTFSLNLDVSVFIEKDRTSITYVFKEIESDILKFEILKNSQIKYAGNETRENYSYVKEGKYLIFENISEKDLIVEIENEGFLEHKEFFSDFLKVDLKIDKLIYIIDIFEEVETNEFDVFPKNYKKQESLNKFIWEYENVSKEILFFINYNDDTKKIYEKYSSIFTKDEFIIAIIFLPIVLFLIFVLGIVLKKPNKDYKEKNNYKNSEKDEDIKDNKKYIEEDSFEKILEKYLTQNEIEVVNIVLGKPGIIQSNILDYLPHLTKSNLSKIISKLSKKTFLERIKVGKETKIYLGSKLKDKIN